MGLLECFNVVYKFLNSATVLRLRAITEQGRWELCGIWFRHLAVWPSGLPRPLQLVWRLAGQKFFSRHQDGTNTENFATSARKCCVYSQKLTWLIAFSDGYLEYILSITLPFYKCKETICFFLHSHDKLSWCEQLQKQCKWFYFYLYKECIILHKNKLRFLWQSLYTKRGKIIIIFKIILWDCIEGRKKLYIRENVSL